ncbi:MAG: glycosyltransferase family 4 protein [candidate division Zixibacteria bacterium]|nr:glycosyltransferase family 4 protein [candidate division Zixibacteria bacterium]
MEAYSKSAVLKGYRIKEAGRRVKTPRDILLLSGFKLDGNKSTPLDILYDRLKADNRAVEVLETGGQGGLGYGSFIRKLLRTIPRYDIIHLYITSFESFINRVLPVIIISKFFGRKVVISYISAESEFYLDRWAKIFKPILAQADKILVPSRYTAEIFNRYGYRVIVQPRPVDIRRFKFTLRSHLQPKILVNRSLELKNNISGALRAFRLVKQKYPRAEIIITGEGSLENDLKALVAVERISGVTFTGRVEPQDMPQYYNEADLFLNPSTVDDIPVTILEAMASGLPVITTDAGGIGEMVIDRVNALVTPINDPVALADRIIELVENENLVEKLSRNARDNVAKYDWNGCQAALSGLYRSLAG